MRVHMFIILLLALSACGQETRKPKKVSAGRPVPRARLARLGRLGQLAPPFVLSSGTVAARAQSRAEKANEFSVPTLLVREAPSSTSPTTEQLFGHSSQMFPSRSSSPAFRNEP